MATRVRFSLPFFFLWVFLFPLPSMAAAPAPRVVVSIAPIHSLVAGVMAGVGTPALIVKGGNSPHSYSLRPSEARALAEAQVIFWVGKNLESFLVRPLATLGASARIVTLATAPGVHLLPARRGGVWEPDSDEAGQKPESDLATYDPHIWLDPQNAEAIVRAAVTTLSQVDPAHREMYRNNGRQLQRRLAKLQADLEKKLAPVRHVPFVVFHDAYQYFDRRFHLRAVGSLTVNPEQMPGARRLKEIRDKILAVQARCVFSEPQFQPRLVATLVEGTAARTGVLDPLGADIAPGPKAYFTLLRRMGKALKSCLGGKSGGA
jgi:zinc transport system substrate-binding protein